MRFSSSTRGNFILSWILPLYSIAFESLFPVTMGFNRIGGKHYQFSVKFIKIALQMCQFKYF